MANLPLNDEVMEDEVGDVVDAPNPRTYEAGGPSTAIVAQPQVIDDLYREMDNLRERQGALARTIVEVSDIEATNSLAIGETHPRPCRQLYMNPSRRTSSCRLQWLRCTVVRVP
ncbi:hypothetical protein Tco_0229340 [Tanacetum coccineum]